MLPNKSSSTLLPTESQTWESHLAQLKWRQGEHVLLIGPTGTGKSHMARALLPRRSYVLVIATKPLDPVMSSFLRQGYVVPREWPAIGERLVIWPKIGRMDLVENQGRVVRQVLHDAYRQGNWCVYVDETQYLQTKLKLAGELDMLWLQGRALGISLVAAAQRPRHIPVAAYSSSSHAYLWPTRDRYDLRRVSEISGSVNLKQLEAAMDRAEEDSEAHGDSHPHTCLYLNPQGRIVMVRAPGLPS